MVFPLRLPFRFPLLRTQNRWITKLAKDPKTAKRFANRARSKRSDLALENWCVDKAARAQWFLTKVDEQDEFLISLGYVE